jgi:hypothetical protein
MGSDCSKNPKRSNLNKTDSGHRSNTPEKTQSNKSVYYDSVNNNNDLTEIKKMVDELDTIESNKITQPEIFNFQNYSQIKADLLKQGQKYIDKHFRPCLSSVVNRDSNKSRFVLYLKKLYSVESFNQIGPKLIWKRPNVILKDFLMFRKF